MAYFLYPMARETFAQTLQREENERLAMPINQIHLKPFHKIHIGDINAYADRDLVATIYVLGSAGSGKSRFLLRLNQEVEGNLVIESGVFDLFQKCVRGYVQRKREEGVTDSIDFHDLDFDMPHIDGLGVHDNFQSGLELEALVNNAPYQGMGAGHYREFLPDMSSGGKSGFPDWLFFPLPNGQYVQVVSFPGHRNIARALENKSIPAIAAPSSVIYLIDPDIESYHHPDGEVGHQNPALNLCDKHLSDVLELEEKGIPTHWFLSKTHHRQLDEHRFRASCIYNGKLAEIGNRISQMDGFDSFDSSREELYGQFGNIIGLD